MRVSGCCLIAVGERLVRAVDGDADVLGLVRDEHGQVGAQLAKVQARDLLVELLRQQVHLVLVLALRLVLAGVVVLAAGLQLRERLVGERVGHDERRVARGAAQVEQAALGQDDDAVAVGEDELVHLRLDVQALGRRLELLHLDLVVEVADVAFSDDEKLLATVGDIVDKQIYVWDMSNGAVVANKFASPDPTDVICWGGHEKDIKRRATQNYVLCSAGAKEIKLWTLNPYTGDFASEACNLGAQVRDWTGICFSPDCDFIYAASTP